LSFFPKSFRSEYPDLALQLGGKAILKSNGHTEMMKTHFRTVFGRRGQTQVYEDGRPPFVNGFGERLYMTGCLIAHEQPNAFAAPYKDKYVAAVTDTLVDLIQTISGALPSFPFFFSHIGDPAKETGSVEAGNALSLLLAPPFLKAARMPIGLQHDPDSIRKLEKKLDVKCEIRKKIQAILTISALNSVVFHEMAHILDGHVAYLKKIAPTYTIREAFHSREATQLNLPLRLKMEISADLAYTDDLLDRSPTDLAIIEKVSRDMSRTDYFALKLIGGALPILLLTIGDAATQGRPRPIDRSFSGDYLPNVYRGWAYWEYLKQMLASDQPDEQIKKEMIPAIELAEQQISLLANHVEYFTIFQLFTEQIATDDAYAIVNDAIAAHNHSEWTKYRFENAPR
jgi:hypothetical protein